MPTNVEIVERFFSEVVNQGRVETIAEVTHPRYRYQGPAGVEAEGRAGVRSIIAAIASALVASRLRIKIADRWRAKVT